jgi:hypothetical protein
MLALLASNLATVVIGLFLSIRYLEVRVAAKPLLAIFSAGLVAWLVVAVLPFGGLSSVEALIADAVVYVIAYIALVPIFFGLDENDLIRLTIAVDTTGPLKGFFRAFIRVERMLLHLRSSSA